jgi:DNA-binding FadR family transcriptional regulator
MLTGSAGKTSFHSRRLDNDQYHFWPTSASVQTARSGSIVAKSRAAKRGEPVHLASRAEHGASKAAKEIGRRLVLAPSLRDVIDKHYGGDPLSAQLAKLLADIGVDGRVPSERELSERLHVSRTALRDRLQLMQSLGLLMRRRGAGTYIRPLDPSKLSLALDLALMAGNFSLESLQSVRMGLERQAALEAAAVRSPHQLGALRGALETIRVATTDMQMDEADYDFHNQLMRGSGNPALAFFADALRDVLHRALAVRRAGMRKLVNDREIMIQLHSDIYVAVEVGDKRQAELAIQNHFDTFDRLVGGLGSGAASGFTDQQSVPAMKR